MTKKFLAGVLILALWVFAMSAFGPTALNVQADPGTSVGNKTYAMLSSSVVVSGVTTTSAVAIFDNVMNNIACDIITNGTATGAVSLLSNISGTNTFAPIMYSAGATTGNPLSGIVGLSGFTQLITKPAGTIQTITWPNRQARAIQVTYSLVVGAVTTTTSIVCAGSQ